MENATAAFTDYLLTVANLAIVGASWTILKTVHMVFPRVKAHSLWARFAPVAPILLCSAAVWIPGATGPMTLGARIMLGVILGAMTANAHKILKQTALGHDERIQNGKSGKKKP